MKLTLANVPGLSSLWQSQRASYNPTFFMLLFLGAGSSADRFLIDYLQANDLMLDNMSGPYSSLVVVADNIGSHAKKEKYRPQSSPELEYLHLSPPLDDVQDSQLSVYTLAHKLSVPLDRFPALLISPDPWDCSDATLFDLGVLLATLAPDAGKRAKGELLNEFFSAIFTAARDYADKTPSKRLKSLGKRGEEAMPRAKGRFQAAIDSGVIAQVVEGLVKGFMPGSS